MYSSSFSPKKGTNPLLLHYKKITSKSKFVLSKNAAKSDSFFCKTGLFAFLLFAKRTKKSNLLSLSAKRSVLLQKRAKAQIAPLFNEKRVIQLKVQGANDDPATPQSGF